MIDLRKVVVIRGQPEDRHKTSPVVLIEGFGELDRCQGFEDGVQGAGEEPGLLAGDHGAGLVGSELFDIPERLRAASVAEI